MFLRSAREAVQDLCDRRGCTLESFAEETVPGAAGGVVVTVTTVARFWGRRCVFRRRIWPPDHPAVAQAGIYATVLEERLLTRVHPAFGNDTSPVSL